MDDRIVLFWSGWPSQWYGSRFTIDGVEYGGCEQFMMAEKARVFHDSETLAGVMSTSNPRKQKELGRRVRGFQPAIWDGLCRGVVFRGNLAKFTQNDGLRALLIATGDRLIAEASPVDRIWGIGLAADNPDASDPRRWNGTNWLGAAIMQVRTQLVDGVEPPPEIQAAISRRRPEAR